MTTADRRAALRDRLIDAADIRISRDGLGALKARDLAQDAGCALGAIYNVFPSLTDLVLVVNARTFRRLGAFVLGELAGDHTPARQMVIMAQAYHHFAAANRHAWGAMFTVDRLPGETAPGWYRDEMDGLFTLIAGPLGQVMPTLSGPERDRMARTLFSAVHGIVALGLDQAAGGVSVEDIDPMLEVLLSRIAGDDAA
jgi:AcrR family transcriptional regulator